MSAGAGGDPFPRGRGTRHAVAAGALAAFLLVLALSGASAAWRHLAAVEAGLAGTATVMVAPGDAEAAAAALRRLPAAASVEAVPPEETAALVAGWLGAGGRGGEAAALGLELPAVLTARFRGEAPPAAELHAALAAAGIAGEATPHRDAAASALEPFAGIRASLAALAAGMVAAFAGAVHWSAAASVRLERATVEVLLLLGAEDGWIRRRLVRGMVRRSAAGAAAGGGAAALLLVAGGAAGVAWIGPGPAWADAAGVAAIAAGTAALAAAVAAAAARHAAGREIARIS
jgi:cell division transport system permease protein